MQLLHAYPVDSLTESRPEKNNLDIYVPPDERFSPKKLSEFISKSIQASVHLLIPEAKSVLKQDSSSFHSFEETRSMFSSNKSRVEGWVKEELKKMVPDKLFKEVIQASKKNPLKFPLPQIIEGELHNCHNLYKPAQLMKHHFHSFCFLFSEDQMAWMDDEEFGRQMIAGTNPAHIRCLEVPTTLRDKVKV